MQETTAAAKLHFMGTSFASQTACGRYAPSHFAWSKIRTTDVVADVRELCEADAETRDVVRIDKRVTSR